ncbi:carbohydrate ABC transporter permease [Brachybacterium sacelli]|uniref:N-acetylglucosamine transport system permease protein n=1 Tax=Brachybacterium sacelli TaxID=173364 RepID=A0ABS4X4B5_9MICO|nr:carbohydrate ABC transporter permease [Brachybacterium sacelli]MBP2383186.1 N-acetylglucosamine transport system permease protein [Brachybacterium sacelli]
MSATSTSAEEPRTDSPIIPPEHRPARLRAGARGGDGLGFATLHHVILTIWALLVILPLLWTIYTSFKTSQEILTEPFGLPAVPQLNNYTRAWTEARIGDYFLNTLIVVGAALIIVMTLGAMCAYVLARFRFPGNRIIYFGIVAGLTFPIFLAVVPLFFVLSNMGLLQGRLGLVGVTMAYVAFALPFTVFFLHSFFANLPEEIGEAAAIDGAGDFRTFFQIMLPMAKPGLASVAIFNFLGLWNQYLLPLVLNTERSNYVLAQGLVNLQAQQGYKVDWGGMFASVVITVIPVIIVYVIFQRQLQGGVGPSTSK